MKNGTFAIVILLCLGLISCNQASETESQIPEREPYEPTWESLQNL